MKSMRGTPRSPSTPTTYQQKKSNLSSLKTESIPLVFSLFVYCRLFDLLETIGAAAPTPLRHVRYCYFCCHARYCYFCCFIFSFLFLPLHQDLYEKGGFGVFAVYEEAAGEVTNKKSSWLTIFDVEDPRSKFPQSKGKFLDANQALEVARFDIQYCDWRARRDVLTIMLLHEKVVEVLNPVAREYKSIGTMKKELAELQEALSQAHKEVYYPSFNGVLVVLTISGPFNEEAFGD